jgi:L-alanine-DL-glutamate epimerase-like enolase superfamily enzyme|tara:strand:- start:195 stop:1298 length:1104 start_codon:yes stop_codon:yes gene_type:complete
MDKIKEIHIYQYDMSILGPSYRFSLSTLTKLDTTLVKIVCESGVSGFGEVCPLGNTYLPSHPEGARAALKTIAPQLIGMNPVQTQVILSKMDLALSGHAYAKAAIDIALWDLKGKIFNLSLSDLLGGAIVDHVPGYYAISTDTPENVANIVIEKQAQGYRRLQIKVGGRDIEEDIAVAHKAFEARAPGIKIVLDANRSLSVCDAIFLSNSCRDLNFILEQPCNSYEEIKSLKGKINHPIFVDESATGIDMICRSIHDDVADGFGMKITRIGGLSNMIAIRDICRDFKRPMTCEDSWGGDIIAAACVHMGATIAPKLLEGVWISDDYTDGNYDEENPITAGAQIKVPTGPGLGINPDTTKWAHIISFD